MSGSTEPPAYPKAGKINEELDTLAGFAVGKPVLIEETFPLACSLRELEDFIEESKKHAAGWIRLLLGEVPGGATSVQDDPGFVHAGLA